MTTLSKKSVEEIYKKQTLHESILNRPDTYVGSDKKVESEMYVYDDSTNKIVRKNIYIVPALLKLFDEAVVNAADQVTRTADKPKGERVTFIKINVDKEDGSIEIINDGPGIPVVMHKTEKMYVPELIFANLLTSSNYNKEEKKLTGGKNGVGIKLAAIFSTKFIVQTVDSVNKRSFKMTMTDNMYKKGKPIVKASSKKPFTSVKFWPDFKRFDLDGFTDDIFAVLKRRAFDISACTATTHNIKIYFNNTVVPIKKFEDYIKLHFDEKKPIVFEQINDRWEVGMTISEEVFEQVSFVNYINTYKGGRHVNYVGDKIVAEVKTMFEKKYKDRKIKSSFIKNRLFLFVNSLIENPSFESQSKESLMTSVKDFGSTVTISDAFMKKVKKTGILEEVEAIVSMKERKNAAKSDGKKVKRLNIPKLDDASKAGTTESHKCSLILTEGDSAKTFAINGLRIIGGEYYGVFPLKGKIMNTRVQSQAKINKNEELKNLKEILGLVHGKEYENVNDLRYGKIVILTDQDVDGSHIKGLLINWLDTEWPSLLKLGFVKSLLTPIVKVFKKQGGKTLSKSFFTISEFEKWKKGPSDGYGNIKYYKGLGTSTEKEQKEAFQDYDKKIVSYIFDEDAPMKMMEAFDKGLADVRKEWLLNYDEDNIIKQAEKNVNITDFVSKDLIHFSQSDIIRSIPSMIDGFKPSQRKIIYAALKRNRSNKGETKVSQFSGYVSAETDYHHGEMSLNAAIVKMAQTFPGSNNIHLLTPSGNFGTRLKGGKDQSQPRYIFTNIEPLSKKIFHSDDNKILDHQYSDNLQIEPEWFMPIVPMVLINGAKGIGTGFSTEILQYDLKSITEALKCLMDKKSIPELTPSYRGWEGEVEKIVTGVTEEKEEKVSYVFKGKYEVDQKNKTITVTELPLYEWTESYKEFLINLENAKKEKKSFYINKFKYISSTANIYFKIYFDTEMFKKVMKDPLKHLRLTKKVATGNMYLFNEENVITKYDTIDDIISSFYRLRLKFYQKRKENLIHEKEKKTRELKMKYLFIKYVIEGKIKVMKTKKKDVEEQLKELKFSTSGGSYDYLTGLPIYSLTLDNAKKIEDEYKKSNEELIELKKLNIKTLWKRELNEILKMDEEINKKLKTERDEARKSEIKSNPSFFKK